MTLDVSQSPDAPEKAPPELNSDQKSELGGIQDIMERLKKGDWAGMVGAIMTVWTEYFGTPEEKEKIRRERKERAEAATQKRTQERLSALHSRVDDQRSGPKKPDPEKKEEDVAVVPYRPGSKKPTVSDKSNFRGQVEQIYHRQDTLFSTDNLDRHFGRDYKKFLTEKDPITGEPITFFGKPITGGVNLMMIPFLRIAERKIMDLDLNYVPAEKEVRGFQDRNMAVRDKDTNEPGYHPSIPSFHKYGLAVDVDPDFNWPKDGRGTIPDEVIVAMAESGFACGNIADPSFYYLMNDTMHYQLRFPPDSAAGQEIINASPIGKKYWNAVKPLLEAVQAAV